jgi:CDGSH-type Zn-finger protein
MKPSRTEVTITFDGRANPPFCDGTRERIGFGRCESGATAPA